MCFAYINNIAFLQPLVNTLGHVSVLLEECIALLAPQPGRSFLDATFGGGGHSRALLERGATVLALDCDPQAEARAALCAGQFPQTFSFRRKNFAELECLATDAFDGILFDFGVSSYQLDTPERGFSFREDAPLDLRLDPSCGQSASEFLEKADREALVRALRDYGEEPRWRRLCDAILGARGSGQLATTSGFAALIESTLGNNPRSRLHPATKAFQGVRIAINDELGAIRQGLPAAFDKLKTGGVLVAISFHSLEDRIVKRLFKQLAGRPEHGGDSRPQDERVQRAELLTRKPVSPQSDEIFRNPRSRSARLRAVRKTETLDPLAA